MAEAAITFHAIDWAFNIAEARLKGTFDKIPDIDVKPSWLDRVCSKLRITPTSASIAITRRDAVGWTYLTYWRRGVTIVEIPEATAARLRDLLQGFKPTAVVGVSRVALRTARALNAIPLHAQKLARDLLRILDGSPSPEEYLFIPLESELFALGRRSVVIIEEQCGREAYENERSLVVKRRVAEAAVLMLDARCVWADHVSDMRLQSLLSELLKLEHGVLRIREVGAVYDRDGGRDFVATWLLAPDRGGDAAPGSDETRLVKERNVLIQVKARKRAVNKGDVTDIRDTLEHYDCDGFLLIAYPRVTVPLFDHLSKLRNRGAMWVDWWELPQIETRLRLNPDVAQRYSDIVTFA
jgi:hypothetical protein